HVDQAGGVDVARGNARDSCHRYEDAAAPEDLDHEAEHPRGTGLRSDRDHDVAHLADLVALRVEDREVDEAGDEDPAGGTAHSSLLRRTRLGRSPMIRC